MSLAARSVRGAAFLTASTLANVAIGFLGGIILARVLAPNDFGTYALAVTVYAFVDLRVKLQLEQKFLQEHDDRPAFFDTFVTLNLLLGGVSLALMLLAALAAWRLFGRPDLGLAMVAVSLASLLDSVSGSLRLASEKHIAFGRVAVFQTAVALAQFGATFLAALAGLGLWSLLLGLGLSALLNLVLFWTGAVRRPAWRLDPGLARAFLFYGLRYGVVFATASVVLTQFDTLAVGMLAGTAAAGYYDRAYRTAQWPTLLLSASLARVSLPAFSQVSDDPARLQRAFSLVLWVVVACAAPVALLFVVAAPDLVETLYGARWQPSAGILQGLAAFAMLRPLWDNLVAVLLAMRRSGLLVRLLAVQAAALVLLVLPLTYFFGGQGTAVAVSLAFLLSAGYLLHFGRSVMRIALYSTVVLPLVNCGLALALYFAVRGLLPFEDWPTVTRLGVTSMLLLGGYLLFSLATSGRMLLSQARYLWDALRR
jgi:PST family polysaccharide transporter